MVNLTREVLIKTIVADEMNSKDGLDYKQQLKNCYQKWENKPTEQLCKQYNKILHTNLTTDKISPCN